MTINKNLVPESSYSLKCPYTMVAEGICVHNTANDAPAKNEISYMVSNPSQTSFHFAVDHSEVWQGLPLDRNGWHAGDGANGAGNRKYIAIEICFSKSGGSRFDAAEDNAAQLIAQLLKERKWDITRVKKHQDFSGKYCPARTLDLGWDRFLLKIKTIMGGTMSDMYNGYDLSNKESMKVCVDLKVKQDKGLIVEKSKYDADVKASFDEGYVKGKSEGSGSSDMPKAEIVIDGVKLSLNGILRKESGKYEASYKLAS